MIYPRYCFIIVKICTIDVHFLLIDRLTISFLCTFKVQSNLKFLLFVYLCDTLSNYITSPVNVDGVNSIDINKTI